MSKGKQPQPKLGTMGLCWKFLRPELENESFKLELTKSAMKAQEIVEVDSKSVEDLLLDADETEVMRILDNFQSDPTLRNETWLSEQDAKELALSLRNIKTFHHQKDRSHSIKLPTGPVSESHFHQNVPSKSHAMILAVTTGKPSEPTPSSISSPFRSPHPPSHSSHHGGVQSSRKLFQAGSRVIRGGIERGDGYDEGGEEEQDIMSKLNVTRTPFSSHPSHSHSLPSSTHPLHPTLTPSQLIAQSKEKEQRQQQLSFPSHPSPNSLSLPPSHHPPDTHSLPPPPLHSHSSSSSSSPSSSPSQSLAPFSSSSLPPLSSPSSISHRHSHSTKRKSHNHNNRHHSSTSSTSSSSFSPPPSSSPSLYPSSPPSSSPSPTTLHSKEYLQQLEVAKYFKKFCQDGGHRVPEILN